MTNGYATHLHFIGKVTEAGGDTMVSSTGKQSQSLTNPQSMALLEAIRELLGGRTSLKEVCYLRWAFRIHSLAPLPVHSLCFQCVDENRTGQLSALDPCHIFPAKWVKNKLFPTLILDMAFYPWNRKVTNRGTNVICSRSHRMRPQSQQPDQVFLYLDLTSTLPLFVPSFPFPASSVWTSWSVPLLMTKKKASYFSSSLGLPPFNLYILYLL